MPIYSKKRWILIIGMSFFFFSTLHAQLFFDSQSGTAIDIEPNERLTGMDLTMHAYFGSQIQLATNLLLETNFLFSSQDIFNNLFVQDVDATLNLNKLSLEYTFVGYNNSSRISLFAGTQDTVGTDQFVRKVFGTQPFNSPLFAKTVGLDQAGIYPINSIGMEVSTAFNNSFATAFYVYYNEKEFEQLNFDIRLAHLSNFAIIDYSIGTSLPFDNLDENGNYVLIPVEGIDLHSALSVLIGNSPFAKLFLQAGFTKILIEPKSDKDILSIEDIHAIIEPRFTLGNVTTAMAAFMFPEETVSLIPYIEHTIGGSFYSDVSANLGRTKAHFGTYVSASYDNLIENQEFDVSRFSVMVTPYTSLSVGRGEMKIIVPINTLKVDNVNEMFSASISYQASF